MARKQSDYLAALLDDGPTDSPAPAPAERGSERLRGTTLLGRESALARVASGEVRQVTQLLLDPARVRIWPGNARSYAHLTEAGCRELIDSIIAEGGQKVFEREAVGYHNPCRKEHLLPRAYAGGRAGDDSRAACQRGER